MPLAHRLEDTGIFGEVGPSLLGLSKRIMADGPQKDSKSLESVYRKGSKMNDFYNLQRNELLFVLGATTYTGLFRNDCEHSSSFLGPLHIQAERTKFFLFMSNRRVSSNEVESHTGASNVQVAWLVLCDFLINATSADCLNCMRNQASRQGIPYDLTRIVHGQCRSNHSIPRLHTVHVYPRRLVCPPFNRNIEIHQFVRSAGHDCV
jgi:hypothetical protein